jgi:glycogen(starch) synthase
VVAGDGPCRDALRDQIRQLRLFRAVSLAGYLDAELPAVMAATDAMVVPSGYEPAGRVVLEAAAAEVPVAVAETGGLTELVDAGRTGVTFAPRDPASLAEAVSGLLSDAQRARRMARAAANLLSDRHSPAAVAAAMAGVYHAVVPAPALFG